MKTRILFIVMSASCCVAADGPVTAAALGISFVDGSTSTVLVSREGRRYLVDLNTHSIADAGPASEATAGPDGNSTFRRDCASCHGVDGKGKAEFHTPDFTNPKVQASFTDEQMNTAIRNGLKGTAMPAWKDRLSGDEITRVAAYIRSLAASHGRAGAVPQADAAAPGVYQAGDDWLMTLPTGRPVPRHGLTVNFAHRFAFDPAFSGPARGAGLFGLDGVAISSFGFRYGVTDKLSVSAYRSPTLIGRPIQLMAAWSLLSESGGSPVNATFRFSVEGGDNFQKNFTENFEAIISRSLTSRAQIYFVPTLSINNRHLVLPASFRSSAIPELPGFNTFSTGVGLAVDIRPTVALVAEVIPTLVNGRPMEIHHPAYAFGVQKKIWRHAFTFGFSNAPGTTVSQRAATRASYLQDPAGGGPGKMFVSFNLMRELH